MIKVIPTSNGVKYVDENDKQIDNTAIDGLPKSQGVVDTVKNAVSNFFAPTSNSSNDKPAGTQWNYDTAAGLAATYGAYANTNPDKNAKVEEAAKILNVPSYAVMRQPELEDLALKKAAEIKDTPDWGQFAQDNPVTATWLSDPKNMAVAHDDFNILAKIEDIGKNFSAHREIRMAEDNLASVLWRNHIKGISDIDNYSDEDKATVAKYNSQIESLRKSVPEYSPTTLAYYFNPNSLAQLVGSLVPGFQKGVERARDGLLLGAGTGALVGSAAGGVGAIPGTAAGAGLGASTGFKIGLGEESAIHDWGQAYYKNITKKDVNGNKMDKTAATASAYAQGAIGFGLGAYGGELASTSAKKIAGAFAKDSVDEVAKNSAIKQLGINLTKSAAEQVALGGGIAAVNYGIEHGAEKLTGQTFDHSQEPGLVMQMLHGSLSMLPFSYISAPGHAADFIRQMNQAAGESKLYSRSPEVFEDHLEAVTKDTPVENMYIPAKELVEYFQESLPEDKAVEMLDKLGISDQISEAVQTGADVEIPTSKFISVLGGTKYADDLATHVKFSEHESTENQINSELQQHYESEMQKAAESNETTDQVQEVESPETQSTFDIFKDKLKGIGYNDKQAESNAHVLSAFADTYTKRTGGRFDGNTWANGIDIVKGDKPAAIDLTQDAPGTFRGSYTPKEDGAIIKVFAAKDNSTMVHEAGHLFLDTMLDIAKIEDLPQNAKDSIVEDRNTIIKWLGAEEGKPLTREQHEKFARGFETYLRDGKAPSVSLMRTFNKFKTWLTNIYKRIADLGVEVTPEVKGVMDRMLASEEQINHAESFKNFTDEMGMKELKTKDFQTYMKLKERAHEEAVSTVLKRKMQELDPELSKEIDKLVDEARPDVEKAVINQPIYQTIKTLEKHNGGRSARNLANEYLTNQLNHNQKMLLDMVADEYGFKNTKAMMQAVFKTRKQEAEVAARLENIKTEYLREKLGVDDPIDESVKATHNETQLHVISLEAEMLREKAKEKYAKPEDKINELKEELKHSKKETEYNQRWNDSERWSEEQQSKMARQGQISYKAAIETAKAMIADKALYTNGKADSVNWRKYLTLERRARAEADSWINKKEFGKALEAKNKEILNHALAIESIKAEREMQKYVAYFNRMDKLKAGSMNINDKYQIDKILSKYELTKKNPDEGILPENRIPLSTWYNGDGGNIVGKKILGFELLVDDNLIEGGNRSYKQLSLNELSDLHDAVKQIEFISRNANRLFKNKMHTDLNECTSELYKAAMDNVGVQHPITTNPHKSKWQRIADIPRFINAELLKVETLTDRLDGFKDKKGEWFHSFIMPISEAYNNKYRRLEKSTTDFQGLLNKFYSKSELKDFRKVTVDIESLGYALSHEDMLCVLLNWGNKGNRQRLLQGKNWTIDNVNEIFGKLSKNDFEFAQHTWDYLDSFWPELVKLEEETSGRKMKKVEPDAFEWDGVTYKGGYYPSKADPSLSLSARINEESIASGQYGIPNLRATTRSGSTKERAVNADYQVRLDLDVVNEHVNEIIHDLTHRKAIMDINRVLYSTNVKEAIQQTMGQDYWFATKDYVDRVAKEGKIQKTQIEQASAKLRSNISIAAMSYKVSVMIPQVLGYVQIAEYMGIPKTLHALTSFAASPMEMKQKIDFAYEKSAFMAERSSNFDRDGREMMKKKFGDKSTLTKVNEKGFWLMGVFDQVATIPCWIEAYKNGMKKYAGDETMAVEHADSIIRQSVGSGAPKDLAKFMAGTEWQRWLTMFSSFTSAFYNMTYRRVQITKGAGDFSTMQRVNGAIAFAAVQLFLAPMLNEKFAGRGPDKDEGFMKWMFKSVLSNTVSMIPVAGQIMNLGISKALGEYASYRATPFNAVADSFGKAVSNGVKQMKEGHNVYGVVKSIGELGAYIAPYPIQFITSYENAYDKFILNKKLDWSDLPYKQHHNK